MTTFTFKRPYYSFIFLPVNATYSETTEYINNVLSRPEVKIPNRDVFVSSVAACWMAANQTDDHFYRGVLCNHQNSDFVETMCRPYAKLIWMLKELENENIYAISNLINSTAPFNPQLFVESNSHPNFLISLLSDVITLLRGDIYDFAKNYIQEEPDEVFEYIHLLGNLLFQAITSGQPFLPPIKIKSFIMRCSELAENLDEFLQFLIDVTTPSKKLDTTLNTLLDKSLDFTNLEKILGDIFAQKPANEAVKKSPAKNKQNIPEVCRQWLQTWNLDKIQKYISQRVIGQDIAVRECSIVLYEHIFRIAHPSCNIRKKNYVMFGPTGCGKTELMRVMRSISPVPVVISNASGLTAAGYKGTNVQDLMDDIASSTPGCQYAIIFLDEFDKLANQGCGDVAQFRQTVQQDILKLLEGEFMFGGNKMAQQEASISSENITFVCGGAFDGAFAIKKKKPAVGFASLHEITGNDDVFRRLIAYGLIPEIVGRINSIIPLRGLDEEDMYNILTKSENSPLKNTKNLFNQAYGVNMVIPDKVLKSICEFAVKQQLGARLLNTILDMAAHKAFHRSKGKRATVTEADIRNTISEFAVSEEYTRKG